MERAAAMLRFKVSLNRSFIAGLHTCITSAQHGIISRLISYGELAVRETM